ENVYEVIAEPTDLTAVREALEQAGVEIQDSELTMRATNRVQVEEDQVAQLMRLIETLEDHDDVAAVHANYDVDAAVLERVLAYRLSHFLRRSRPARFVRRTSGAWFQRCFISDCGAESASNSSAEIVSVTARSATRATSGASTKR